jgi:hypothetical protein
MIASMKALQTDVSSQLNDSRRAPDLRERSKRSRFAWMAVATLAVHGCTAHVPPDHARTTGAPTGTHDLTCEFVGLESVQGSNDENSDAVTLLAVYRFSSDRTESRGAPLSLKFELTRSRVDELRAHLTSPRQVVCSPDEQSNYSARVEPFDGEKAVPVPNPEDAK